MELPYLVFDCLQHGTLPDPIQKNTRPIEDRCEPCASDTPGFLELGVCTPARRFTPQSDFYFDGRAKLPIGTWSLTVDLSLGPCALFFGHFLAGFLSIRALRITAGPAFTALYGVPVKYPPFSPRELTITEKGRKPLGLKV